MLKNEYISLESKLEVEKAALISAKKELQWKNEL